MLSRLKFEIVSLVNEILDRLPAHVWTSETTTFLDPAMAGGQFIREIVNRLRKHGWSDDNIAKRVYGLADTPLSLNFVKNKYNIPGTFSVGGIEQLEKWVEMGMKFDVVVGNPPYQADATNSDKNLWADFVSKSTVLVFDGGLISLITPPSWLAKQKIKTGKKDYTPFKDNKLLMVKILTEQETQKYFKGVGSKFSWFIMEKNSPTNNHFTKFIQGNEITVHRYNPDWIYPLNVSKNLLSITEKLNSVDNYFKFKKNNECHSQVLKRKQLISDERKDIFINPVYYSHNIKRYTSIRSSIFNFWKVLIPKTGTLKDAFVDNDCNVNEDVRYFITPSKDDAINLLQILNSKLYRFIGLMFRTGRNLEVSELPLPKVDLSRSWTDEELYAHFNLTEEEIKLIEETIK